MKLVDDIISKRKKFKLKILMFGLLLAAIFICEYFYRLPLFQKSIEIVDSINYDHDNTKRILLALRVFSTVFTSFYLILFVFVLVYNFSNIYKTFFIIYIGTVSVLVGSLLELIYTQPLMYYSNYFQGKNMRIQAEDCTGGWGNPSIVSILMTSILLSLHHIMINNSRFRQHRLVKVLLLAIGLLIIIIVNISKFFIFIHSLNQILFGLTIGLAIYLFAFLILEVDLNDGNQFIKISSVNIFYVLLIDVGILGLFIALYIISLRSSAEYIPQYNQNIDNSLCNERLPDENRFSSEAFFFFFVFLSKLGMMLGVKYEQEITFKGDYEKWKTYNFEKDPSEKDSVYSRQFIMQVTQWNHTTIGKSLVRVVVLSICSCLICLPTFLIPFGYGVLSTGLFKVFLPIFILLFMLFSLFKSLMRILNLTNEDVHLYLLDNEESLSR